jgi:hypothetical protein
MSSPSGAGETFAGKPAIVLAEAGRIKLILCSIPWAAMGLPLLICGPWMAVTEAAATGDRVSILLGCGMAAAGWILTGFMACRLRAAFDPRIRVVAGPGGVDVFFPSGPLPQRFFMTYRIRNQELRSEEISKVYPRLSTVNGIPITSEVVISGPKWHLKVESKFFDASADELALGLRSALGGWKDS